MKVNQLNQNNHDGFKHQWTKTWLIPHAKTINLLNLAAGNLRQLNLIRGLMNFNRRREERASRAGQAGAPLVAAAHDHCVGALVHNP